MKNKYEFQNLGEGKIKYLIDGKDGSECKGESFYKYYALTDYSVEALTHLYVYASHPNQLNDPFDCADGLIQFDDIDSARLFAKHFYPAIQELCENNDDAILDYVKSAYRTYLYTELGILCLSKTWDDVSMWSNYTNHKGFCVEFDVFSFPFDFWGPFKINYHEKLVGKSVREIGLPIVSLYQTNVKLNTWEHEHEWRLLIKAPEGFSLEPYGEYSGLLKQRFTDYHDRKYKYPMKCLKSVCLGLDFFDDITSIISENEREFIVIDNKKNAVMSFLALSRTPTYVLQEKNLKLTKIQIDIIQIRENTYRIIS